MDYMNQEVRIMSAKLENQYGTISIENEVIARIAGLTAVDCYGIVGMAAKNMKDGLVQLLKRCLLYTSRCV